MSETDQIKIYTIRGIATRVTDEIAEAARTSVPKVTVGQLIENIWDHWKRGAIIVSDHHRPTAPMPSVEEVCAALDAVSKISHLGEAVQLGVKNEANRLAKVLLLDLKIRYRSAVGTGQSAPPLAIVQAIGDAADRIPTAAARAA